MKTIDKVAQSREGRRFLRLMWKVAVSKEIEEYFHQPWIWYWGLVDFYQRKFGGNKSQALRVVLG